jgi:hypothetical protein
MFILDPGSPFRIPDQKTTTKEEGGKKIRCLSFVVTKKFDKIKINLFTIGAEKKFEPIDEELKYFLPNILSLSSQKYGLGIRDPKKNLSRNHGSNKNRTPDPQHYPSG